MYETRYSSHYIVHDDGTNSPIAHQIIISRLTIELGVLYYHKQTISLLPLPETPLGEGPGHQVPDILLYDNQAEQTKLIIEVAQPRTAERDVYKIIHLIENDHYGIEEGFVYNYHTGEWFRYRKGDGGAATNSSVSELLGVDLGTFL